MEHGAELFGSTYRRGEVVFRQGDPGDSMYIIQSGAVEVSQHKNGRETVRLPQGSTDAILAPYHIDRSKLFVRERFGNKMLNHSEDLLDAERIADYIEMTRFPVPDDEFHRDTSGLPGLVRAADFIGQLADPNRMQKCTALFYEFEEVGLNETLGYQRPGDLRECNAKFYWKSVNPYIQEATRYLKVTQDGRQWVANLQANVFGDKLFNT